MQKERHTRVRATAAAGMQLCVAAAAAQALTSTPFTHCHHDAGQTQPPCMSMHRSMCHTMRHLLRPQIEARRLSDGHLVCRDTMGAPVAGMLVGDYRSDGTQQLVVLSCDGEVRGYLPQQPGSGPAAPEVDLDSLQATITQLGHRKQVRHLLLEAPARGAGAATCLVVAVPGMSN